MQLARLTCVEFVVEDHSIPVSLSEMDAKPAWPHGVSRLRGDVEANESAGESGIVVGEDDDDDDEEEEEVVEVLHREDAEHWVPLERVALNEIFLAERNVAHPIQHELVVNGATEEADVQLSSGILISTGTGSAAWIANATKVSVDTVQRVLDEAGHPAESEVGQSIADRINEDTIFEPSSPLVRYFVREVVSNGLRPNAHLRGGLVRDVTVRSRGWDPTMTLDGIHEYALPAGQRAHFDTDESVSLLSCAFPECIS